MKQSYTLKGEYMRKARGQKADPAREARATVDELREALSYPVTLARVIENLPAPEREALRQVAKAARDSRAAAAALVVAE